MFVLPVKFSFFSDEEYPAWDILDYVFDCIFGVDLILTFLTPYLEDGKMITSLWEIAKNYLTFWFWLDLLSIFPFELILNTGEEIKLVRVSRLPRLYKLIKIVKMMRSIKATPFSNFFEGKMESSCTSFHSGGISTFFCANKILLGE